MTSTSSPLGILQSAIKAVPAVKYALGIAGIIAAVAIVAGFNIDFRIAVFGTVIMFVLMTALVIFARVAGTATVGLAGPATVLTWFSLLLMMATATALFTSVFFSWPVDLQWVLQRHDTGDDNKSGKADVKQDSSKAQPSPTAELSPKEKVTNASKESTSAKEGPTEQLRQWDEFVGVWESDELQDPLYTLPQQGCVQNLTRKFQLQVVETTPNKYAANFGFQATGSTHVQKDGEILTTPPCSSSIAPFHGGHDFPASIVTVSNHILSIEIAAWQDHLLLKFKHAGNDRLLALPGGIDTLLNNENRASLNNTGFLLHRR